MAFNTARYRSALRLPLAEWVEICRGQVALLKALVAVRLRPTGRLISQEVEEAPTDIAWDVVARVERGVHRAASYGLFRPRCLVKAVALHRSLLAHGIHGSRIRIGVQVSASEFDAHAWVMVGDHVVGDAPVRVQQFKEVMDGSVVEQQ